MTPGGAPAANGSGPGASISAAIEPQACRVGARSHQAAHMGKVT
jgi:hypothetical protein